MDKPSTGTEEITPQTHHWQRLPGASFADSYRTALAPQLVHVPTHEIARRMMKGRPTWLTVTTVVRPKRWLGKLYLTAIMPFHRCIVRTPLRRMAA